MTRYWPSDPEASLGQARTARRTRRSQLPMPSFHLRLPILSFFLQLFRKRRQTVLSTAPKPPLLEANLDCTPGTKCYYRPADAGPRAHYHGPSGTLLRRARLFGWHLDRSVLREAPEHSFCVSGPPPPIHDPSIQSFALFLGLPPELREHVYGYYMETFIDGWGFEVWTIPRPPPLTKTSRLVRRETLPIFSNQFGTSRLPLMPKYDDRYQWFYRFPSECLDRIRHARLYLGCSPFDKPEHVRSFLIDFDPANCTVTIMKCPPRHVRQSYFRTAMYGFNENREVVVDELREAVLVTFDSMEAINHSGREVLEALVRCAGKFCGLSMPVRSWVSRHR